MTDGPNDTPEPTSAPRLAPGERIYLDRLRGELGLYRGGGDRANILHLKLAIEMFMNIEEDPRPYLPELEYVSPTVKAAHTAVPYVPAAPPTGDATDVVDRHLIEITDVDGAPSSELVEALGVAEAAFDSGEDYWVNITMPNGAVLTVATETLDMVPAPTTAPPPPIEIAPPTPPPASVTAATGAVGSAAAAGAEAPLGGASAAIPAAGMAADLSDRRGCLLPIVAIVAALVIIGGGIALLVNGGDEDEGDVAPSSSAPADSDTDSDGSGGLPLTEDGPADVSEGIPDAPVVLNPCDLLDDAFVQGASGTPWAGVGSEVSGGNRQICEYYPPPADESGQESVYIQMEATLNSNSDDFFIDFQDRYPTLLKSLEWGRGGNAEVRQSEGFVTLWGHVIADDPLGRDLFVWIAIGNIDAAAGTAAAEEIGTTLRDELLANQ